LEINDAQSQETASSSSVRPRSQLQILVSANQKEKTAGISLTRPCFVFPTSR
jgi:hypothetical protein